MRFEQLSVPAFGPFTKFELSFPTTGRDFHLIYGPNEAGKSSLLRAVRDLLYGIDSRTTDNFLHAYKDLRIAGSIAAADGRQLRFQRRKGNKDTLLDAHGQALPDDALSAFLGNVDRDAFDTLFGLGAEELRQGAETLLQGRGEVGEALFAAHLAGTPVHHILDQLEADARAIYSGRSVKNVTLRPAVSAHALQLQQSRQSMVRPETWAQALTGLAEVRGERDALDLRLKQGRARRDWLQRCLDALPVIGKLGEQERRRAELPQAPALGADFIDSTEQSIAKRDRMREQLSQSQLRVEQFQQRVRDNQPDAAVLERAVEIESAHQQLAVWRQWGDERAALEADLVRAETGLRAGMRSLGINGEPEVAEALRVVVGDELALRDAASALDAADAALRDKTVEHERLTRSVQKTTEQLAKLPAADVTSLRDALAATASAAEAERKLPARHDSLTEARARLADQHALLAAAPADYTATFQLPVPAAATLRRFESELTDIEASQRQAAEAAREADTQLRELQAQLARLERRGALPSLSTLTAARGHRDQAWTLVLAAWQLGTEPDLLDDKPLAEAYPLTVAAADDIADALRADAEAVAQAEELRLRLQQLARAKADAASRLEQIDALRADWQARWTAVWSDCHIAPQSPAEMLEWRDHWGAFRTCYQSWRSAADACDGARAAIDSGIDLLAPLLPDRPTAALSALRDAADRQVREADKTDGVRETLQRDAAESETALQACAAALPTLREVADGTRDTWHRRCEALDLSGDLSPDQNLALLDQRKQLVAELDDWNALRQARQAKARAIEDYEATVQALADALSIAAGAVPVREHALRQALDDARERQTRQDQARSDLTAESEQVASLQDLLTQAERRIADALSASTTADEAALKALLDTLRLRRRIDAEIEQHRQALIAAARGEAVDAFIERVRSESADELVAERDSLDQDIPGLEAERDEAMKRQLEAEAEKRRLEQSGAEAAEHLQAAEHQAAAMRRDAARYLRLQLAVQFLRAQIEQYRKQNQAPLLQKAGGYFKAITRDSFDGLGTAYGADDIAVLVGLRDGTEIGVLGMSEGTRDQLYLALRLAAIEHHQQHHEPMPVILDDLLMTFDNDRASAILPILSDLGTRTQVLLFSHHQHLLELAREALTPDRVHYHGLQPDL